MIFCSLLIMYSGLYFIILKKCYKIHQLKFVLHVVFFIPKNIKFDIIFLYVLTTLNSYCNVQRFILFQQVIHYFSVIGLCMFCSMTIHSYSVTLTRAHQSVTYHCCDFTCSVGLWQGIPSNWCWLSWTCVFLHLVVCLSVHFDE